MKTDSNVLMPLLGIILVAVLGLVYYLGGLLAAKYFGTGVWLWIALILTPASFLVLVDFSR